MRIAILTLPLHTNYGGILQAYALQTVLQNYGNEVEILQKISPFKGPRFIRELKKLRSIPNQFISRWNIDHFLSKNLKLKKIVSFSELHPDDYDAIVVGSDQVWRAEYFRGIWGADMKDAFLNFTKDWSIIRLSYAASFGTDTLTGYSKEDIRECKEALHLFDKISLRERSGVDICKKVFGVNATQVLDPTMLLDREYYERIIADLVKRDSTSGIYCYILDPSSQKDKIVNNVAKGKRLKVHNMLPSYSEKQILKPIFPSVESWLRGFADAEVVITDSFHACVFSIIFGKPFLVIDNSKRGSSRFESLLNQFGLEKNIIRDDSLIYPENICTAN